MKYTLKKMTILIFYHKFTATSKISENWHIFNEYLEYLTSKPNNAYIFIILNDFPVLTVPIT